jgi:hypothetical protein
MRFGCMGAALLAAMAALIRTDKSFAQSAGNTSLTSTVAMQNYIDCLENVGSMLVGSGYRPDPFVLKPDPNVVGAKVAAECQTASDNLLEATLRTAPPEQKDQLRQDLQKKFIEWPVKIILRMEKSQEQMHGDDQPK